MMDKHEGITHYPTRIDLARAVCKHNGTGIEIGVMRGTNAMNLFNALTPISMYLVDPWKNREQRYLNVAGRFKDKPQVTCLRKTGVEACGEIPDGSLDWCVIDIASGFGPNYETLLTYDKKMAIGGIILAEYYFVDYHGQGMMKAVHYFLTHHPEYRAVGFSDDTKCLALQKTSARILWPTREAMYKILPKASKGIEVGVLNGDNASSILNTVHPSQLILIDAWKAMFGHENQDVWDGRYVQVMTRFAEHMHRGIVQIVRAMTRDAAKTIPDNSVDWVYIDAEHEYAGVKEDLGLYIPKVRPGGCIMCHDYTHYRGTSGVVRAVQETIDSGQTEMIGLTGELKLHTAMLRKVSHE